MAWPLTLWRSASRSSSLTVIGDGEAYEENIGVLNRLDGCIMQAPATCQDDVIIKLLLVTANLAMGAGTADEDAMSIAREARAFGFEFGMA